MELIIGGIVGSLIVYTVGTGMYAAHQGKKTQVNESRKRFIARSEPEVLDKMPEVWVLEAEEDFEATKDHQKRLAATQRSRDLGMMRRSGK